MYIINIQGHIFSTCYTSTKQILYAETANSIYLEDNLMN